MGPQHQQTHGKHTAMKTIWLIKITSLYIKTIMVDSRRITIAASHLSFTSRAEEERWQQGRTLTRGANMNPSEMNTYFCHLR